MAGEWSNEDVVAARAEGWNLYEIWDGRLGRLELMIQAEGLSSRFQTDDDARRYVAAQVQAGDKMAERAMRLSFLSRVTPVGKKAPRKNKES